MTEPEPFDLRDFTPYLLNLAAEQSSLTFQSYYKDRYGMLRTEWRVVFHLGRYGPMTAKEICSRARLHKTKVSRAVSALEKNRFLVKSALEQDRRLELLKLTKTGKSAFADLYDAARRFDAELVGQFTENEREVLHRCLTRIAGL
jgi:DNA-binding MarR family transcriptional regulator